MRIHVSKEASQDMDDIFVYWAERVGIDVADRLVDEIVERFSLLAQFPLVGRKCERIQPGALSFPVGKYVIYYRKSRAILQILHVFHGARDQARAFTLEGPL
jgi:toxin ParE1/3/4